MKFLILLLLLSVSMVSFSQSSGSETIDSDFSSDTLKSFHKVNLLYNYGEIDSIQIAEFCLGNAEQNVSNYAFRATKIQVFSGCQVEKGKVQDVSIIKLIGKPLVNSFDSTFTTAQLYFVPNKNKLHEPAYSNGKLEVYYHQNQLNTIQHILTSKNIVCVMNKYRNGTIWVDIHSNTGL